jgi:glycosyltransferase involved in cell wall biosynthesis
MRILILTQYYPPETGAPQNRLSDLAKRLQAKGHALTVLTALPNYPRGQVFDEYRGRLWMEENQGGVRTIRTWIYATKRTGFSSRLLNYFSFTITSVALGIWKLRKQDVVVVESPPLFIAISGYMISRLLGARLVFNVSDLWPESAVVMGVLRSKLLIRLSSCLERFAYRKSHLVTGQTRGIVASISSRFPLKRVELVSNGVDVEFFQSVSDENQKQAVKRQLGVRGDIVIGYAGLHGLAQALETVILAAEAVRDHNNVSFGFFGDGPEKNRLIELAKKRNLTNVQFFPSQAKDKMRDILRVFDIAVVPLKRLPLFQGALPSKLFEAMAAGVPIVLSVDGEARHLIDEARCGIYVEPENPVDMANGILGLCADATRREKLGQNGRRFVFERYNREHIASHFETLLRETV